MVNLSKTKMLRVRDKNGRFVKMQKGYYDILDKATMQVASGATDFHTAMRESIKQMGSGGMRVEYESGVHRWLDTVVRQNLLWGAKQASTAYNEMIGEELGCDGIEIDYHSNPRPSHADMQGKQYVLGKARVINISARQLNFITSIKTAKIFWLLVKELDINYEDVDELHSDCVEEVKKINGAIEYQIAKNNN